MGEEVAIPASVARELAISASDAVAQERQSGFRYNAKSIQDAVAETFEEVGIKDGEFVGLSATKVSTLLAFADHADAEDSIRTGREILEREGYW